MEDRIGQITRTSFHPYHGMHQSESTPRRNTFGTGMPIKSQQKASLRWDKEEQGEYKV
jgi:hypothetical protein